jgi:predicted RNA binding protein YcfA (HicA-like mRNA interferase family)
VEVSVSERLPRISGKEMGRLLEAAGFTGRAGKGSHTFYKDAAGRKTVVAAHGAQDLSVTMIAKVLRDIGMSHDEYRQRVADL